MTYSWIDSFILTFVPLFIVIDAIGNVPVVVSMSERLSRESRIKIYNYATITAAIVGLVFLFLGQLVLNLMGISVGSFAIAGGIILLVLSIRYMTTGRMVEIIEEEMVAVVPIGTPLTVGPATITTLLLLATQFSIYWVLLSFVLNMVIVWVSFRASFQIVRFLGQGGIKAVSRVASLLLAAIGINMVVKGLALLNILEAIP